MISLNLTGGFRPDSRRSSNRVPTGRKRPVAVVLLLAEIVMPRRCIFCNEYNRMTKEHIWPAWLGKMLLKTGKEKHTFGSITEQEFKQLSDNTFERAGHLTSLTLPVVCADCNNTWMSRIEASAKPLLLDLINTKTIKLDSTRQELLARWIAMKVITGEHAERKQDIHVTPTADRLRLRSHAEMPPYFSIYLGSQTTEHDSAWARMSWTMAFSSKGPSPKLEGRNRNCQTVSILFGPLMVFVLTVRLDDPRAEGIFRFGGPLAQIWPPKNEIIAWPPIRPLTRAEMSKVAWISDELKRGPNIRYIGELPPEA